MPKKFIHERGDKIETCIFYKEKDKQEITVGFSKKNFSIHSGISGLKYYLIIMYMRKHVEHFGEINTTLNKMVDECGYSSKSHNQSSYIDFRSIIKEEVIDKGYATSKDNIMKVQPSSLFTLKLSEEKSIFYTDDNFVQLSIQEFEKLMQPSTQSINKSVLIGAYLFIKQYILSSDVESHLPKISYPSKQQIKKGIGISSITTIEKAISALVELGLIFVSENMYMEDSKNKGVYVPTRNVYAISKADLTVDACANELQRVYGKPIYTKANVPGEIQYLTKKQNNN